jgi:PAS domain S-box-containing protein
MGEVIQEAMEGGSPRLEALYKRASGEEFSVDVQVVKLPEAGRNLVRVSFVDITEQKAAQQEIFESQQRLSLMVEQSPVAVIEWNTDFEVVAWNRAAEEIFGYKAEEAMGRHAAGLLVPEEAREAVDEVWANLLKQTGGDRSTNENFTKDGRTILCDWFNTPLVDEQGNTLGVTSMVFDITERKAAEETIVQGDRLKSEFLANMSHELRTPLNSIVGYTDVLLLGMDGDLPEEIIKDVEAIQENSHTLLGLIDDILDLAKIEAGRMTFEVSEVSIPDLYGEITRESAGLIVNKPLEIRVDAPADLPTITADSIRVKQIITNLLSNAIKFTDEGTITLRAFEENHEWLVLQVEDTGVGMSEDDLNIIFEKFRQADGSYARVAEGTGLGLNITQQLVQLHGGKIDVKSELNVGSTFTVWLPVVANFSPLVSVKKLNKQKA